MNADFLYLKNMIKKNWCEECDIEECRGCQVKEVIQLIEQLDAYYGETTGAPSGDCRVCKDKKGNNKRVEYFDAANNFREADYCPSCGRRL